MLMVGGVALTDERRRRHRKVYRDALRLADLTLDQAARECERDVRQVGRWFDVTEGTLPHLAKLPDKFFAWLGLRLYHEYGPVEEIETAAAMDEKRSA